MIVSRRRRARYLLDDIAEEIRHELSEAWLSWLLVLWVVGGLAVACSIAIVHAIGW